MKQNKETLKQFFETGDKPTQQQYADLIDSYIDAKQPEGEVNRRFVIDETGEVSVASEQQVPEYTLSPISGTNTVDLLKDGVSVSQIDLTPYLDNTNLARLVSGTVDANGVATFTRDDNSTFTVDLSNLKDNPTLQNATDNGNATTNEIKLINTKTDNYLNLSSSKLTVDSASATSPYRKSELNSKSLRLYRENNHVTLSCSSSLASDKSVYLDNVAHLNDIPQIQAGSNITIDNTDPLQPVINATAGSGGTTDLSYDVATRTVASSSGTGAVLPLADATNAGLQKANFYEEGTFTPALEDANGASTYSSSIDARFKRVGNIVQFSIFFNGITTNVTPSGSLKITGMPFSAETAPMGTTISFNRMLGSDSSQTPNSGYVGNTTLYLRDQPIGATLDSGYIAPTFTTGVFALTGTYTTNVYTP
ncbi:hypothetical protein [Tenacibaculum sp. Ill]|uniref:hypothetical protein n=1 Tax=Tenacibaculum sp. Ill TaxID=3445935 RepID=UPI003F793AE8